MTETSTLCARTNNHLLCYVASCSAQIYKYQVIRRTDGAQITNNVSKLMTNKSKMIDHFVIDHHIASQHHTRLYSAQYYAQYLLDLDSADFRQSACGRGRAARRTASWRRVAYTPNTNDVATITSTCTTMLELRHLHGLLTEATAGSRTLADGKASMYGGLR